MLKQAFRTALLITLATAPGGARAQTALPTAAQTDAAAAPTRGPVTNLPLPRYVSLKTDKGNARRGPSLTHRVDWVFTRPGMPLRITAEFDHWRRVEDADGVGGWVHYALLSGARTALVAEDLADLHASPDPRAPVVARAELGVVARVIECTPDWCRVGRDGLRGWIPKSALWGVDPGERFN